jgi:hypothetical protein
VEELTICQQHDFHRQDDIVGLLFLPTTDITPLFPEIQSHSYFPLPHVLLQMSHFSNLYQMNFPNRRPEFKNSSSEVRRFRQFIGFLPNHCVVLIS